MTSRHESVIVSLILIFAKLDADDIIAKSENPDNLYQQKTNENMLIGILKDDLIVALLDTNPRSQSRKINAIIREAARYSVPIRPGRSFPRKRKHSNRFHRSKKSAL